MYSYMHGHSDTNTNIYIYIYMYLYIQRNICIYIIYNSMCIYIYTCPFMLRMAPGLQQHRHQASVEYELLVIRVLYVKREQG